ncbi:MAG: 4Fe-4S binding protein [Bacteroidales bacterium]|nr:4Fe-4S binding protein [Bacteroidales bacterium]
MSITRRGFFKAVCATGAVLALGRELQASPSAGKGGIEYRGMLYDSTLCKGCHGCEFDCAEANGLPYPELGQDLPPIRTTSETQRTVVNTYSTSKGEVFVKVQCMHCNEPACVAACLTQAMFKSKAGPVIWREDKCMGCRYCMVSCPFNIPKFEYHSPNPKIIKCDLCYNRLKTGEIPACAANCPNEALFYGTRRQLIKEARRRIVENPTKYVDYLYGEDEAGGTCWLYLSPVKFEEIGMKTTIQKSSYPALTKGFLYSVPTIFVLFPALLLGMHQATKNDHQTKEE